uniref:Uncharacterized protein n=1 Tax=Anguilla anguilla TaxID=7936 RepID=A0A0E9QZD1_ANGAN
MAHGYIFITRVSRYMVTFKICNTVRISRTMVVGMIICYHVG